MHELCEQHQEEIVIERCHIQEIDPCSLLSSTSDSKGRDLLPGKVLATAGGGILNRGNLTLSHVILAHNRAVGDLNIVVAVNPLYNLAGNGLGGAIANFGTLSVNGCTFTGNQALGADNADSSAFSFPGPAFSGSVAGGAIDNLGSASVTGSTFTSNLAQAGSGGRGDFAAIGSGGAIYNDGVLTATRDSFRDNQALGGSNSVNPFHNGHALGGAISSGSLLPLAGGPGATLVVNQSVFSHNQARGGNDNLVTLPLAFVSPADGPDNGYGGAITVYQGSATVRHSTLDHNRAVGGAGGAAQNGSLGVGGGIFFFSFIGGVTATLSDSTIAHNDAIGGAGRSGGNGGDGLGGGIAAGSLGAPFGAPGTDVITSTLVALNTAQGGAGGLGGNGGNAQGGGIFNAAASTLTLTHSLVLANQARGGDGVIHGQGQGGGVFNDPAGLFQVDAFSRFWIRLNEATEGDDVFGLLTLL
jgi:hypothetical protein